MDDEVEDVDEDVVRDEEDVDAELVVVGDEGAEVASDEDELAAAAKAALRS